MFLTLPNLLSILRLPLAFLFLQSNPYLRVLVVIAAMLTDFLDGFLARKYNLRSRVGTTLDPMTDKFFVIFVLGILYQEGQIALWEAASMLCRDLAVMLFGLYLVLVREWDDYQFRAIWCGKIATTLQFFVLIALALHYPVYQGIYLLFIVLGAMALFELYFTERKLKEG